MDVIFRSFTGNLPGSWSKILLIYYGALKIIAADLYEKKRSIKRY
jgi:hypothetical protein